MGRTKQSKPVQKRRRIDEREDQAEQEAAISLLRNAPKDVVEAAATDAFRSNVNKWDRLDGPAPDGGNSSSYVSSLVLPREFGGLGRCPIDLADFVILEKLHETIKRKAEYWTSWSGAEDDPRKRAFGFLPSTLGSDNTARSTLDVSMPNATSEAAAEEKSRNARAAVLLDDADVPAGFEGALGRLLDKLRPFAPTPLHRYFSVDQLVAAQPNLHSGQHILPPHVDHPAKDGFGVVIVTVAIRGKAQILLETCDRKRQATFTLTPRHAYLLSGPVRDACVHGVLSDEGKDGANRESLNLRLGLHGRTHSDPPTSDVLRHWRNDMMTLPGSSLMKAERYSS